MQKLSKSQAGKLGAKASHETTQHNKQLRIKHYTADPNSCTHCNNILIYKKRHNKFCSSSCSASYTVKRRTFSTQNKKKEHTCSICESKFLGSIHLSKNNRICNRCRDIHRVIIVGPYTPIYKNTCKKTNIIFYYHKRKKYHPTTDLSRREYYDACRFTFSLKHTPGIENISLIEEIGWFSNKKTSHNINGASRDHMYSVSDGWQNNIDPNIISHPANCTIMSHAENRAKNFRSSITLPELHIRINNYDNKFGANIRNCPGTS